MGRRRVVYGVRVGGRWLVMALVFVGLLHGLGGRPARSRALPVLGNQGNGLKASLKQSSCHGLEALLRRLRGASDLWPS